MDCPNCHVYNPEDRTVCWRCDKPLPKPVEKKKKPKVTSQQWLYIMVAVMVVLMAIQMCGLPKTQQSNTGSVPGAPVGLALPLR